MFLLFTFLLSTSHDLSPAMVEYLRPALVIATTFESVKPNAPRAVSLADGIVEKVHTGPGNTSRVLVGYEFYFNDKRVRKTIEYKYLEMVDVEVGQRVNSGQVLGRWSRAAMRNHKVISRVVADMPSALHIGSKREVLLDPLTEPTLLLVDQNYYRMAIVRFGVLEQVIDLAFGQGRGKKLRRGDLRTPKGMYFVVQKHRGAFSGDYADYYGGHWLKINYPNRFDAERGVATGLLDRGTARGIARNWSARKLTYQGSRLGSSIGFHGWIEDWRAGADPVPRVAESPAASNGRHLSWGCLVLDNADIAALYDSIPLSTMVVIL